MPSRREEIILNAFLGVVKEGWRGLEGTGLTRPVAEASSSEENVATPAATGMAQSQLLDSYASLVRSSPLYDAVQDDSRGSAAAKVASALFGNALGMVPLAKAIFSLFGSGDEEPPALVKFALPASQRFEAASAGGTISGSDYGQDGLPRAYSAEPAAMLYETAKANQSSPQVTVQVQAMDSRSFLDHKDDIARAVREAMLNMHPLNDVVSEL